VRQRLHDENVNLASQTVLLLRQPQLPFQQPERIR